MPKRLPRITFEGVGGRGVLVSSVLDVVGGEVVPARFYRGEFRAEERGEDVAVAEKGGVLLVPVLLEGVEFLDFSGRDVVVCYRGVAPEVAVDFGGGGVEGRGGVGLEVGECAVEGDFHVLESFAEGEVADPVGACEVFVGADVGGLLGGDFKHGGVGEHEACAAVAKFDVVDVEVLADVVRFAGVEGAEVREEVVPA